MKRMDGMNENPLKIQRIDSNSATVADANEWYKVVESGFGGQAPWSVGQILDTLQAKNAVVLVATLADEKVGLLAASKTIFELDIYLVVVSQNHKKKQIGTELFKYLTKYAEENNILDIVLEVRASNMPAIKLYERANFKRVGSRKAYYSNPIEDAIVMKRELGEEM